MGASGTYGAALPASKGTQSMSRTISAILLATFLMVLAGCESCQQERIQRAERESAYSSPRTLSWNPFECWQGRSD
jgi:hypothetical protein